MRAQIQSCDTKVCKLVDFNNISFNTLYVRIPDSSTILIFKEYNSVKPFTEK